MPKVTTGISVDDIVVRKAKIKASSQRRTFSNYVEGLIRDDLEMAPVINIDGRKKSQAQLKRRRR